MTNIEILTHQALQSIDCKMCDQNEINWEQRRYEIAKECLPIVYKIAFEIAKKAGVVEKPKNIVAVAVDLADVLISELQKDKN